MVRRRTGTVGRSGRGPGSFATCGAPRRCPRRFAACQGGPRAPRRRDPPSESPTRKDPAKWCCGAPAPPSGQVGGGARSRRAVPPDAIPGVSRLARGGVKSEQEKVHHPQRPTHDFGGRSGGVACSADAIEVGRALVRAVRHVSAPSRRPTVLPGRSSWTVRKRSTIRSTCAAPCDVEVAGAAAAVVRSLDLCLMIGQTSPCRGVIWGRPTLS